MLLITIVYTITYIHTYITDVLKYAKALVKLRDVLIIRSHQPNIRILFLI